MPLTSDDAEQPHRPQLQANRTTRTPALTARPTGRLGEDSPMLSRESLPAVSHQAVYDSLHTLTEVGLLRCIKPSGSVARYERRIGDNHHHLVCRSCSLIVDVDCTIGQAPCLTPSHDAGFVIDQAEVTFWGLCPDCTAAGAQLTGDDQFSAV
jgi:Fe2+ or Zn2+ uptake regulation protein